MHQDSYVKMGKFLQKYLDPNKNLEVLDVGSMDVNGTYKPLFAGRPNWHYVGCDLGPGPNVDVPLANKYVWDEIEADSKDVVISGQAFEHIEYIWNSILEIARVLKEGGLSCIIAPAIFFEHKHPVDCWRFYPDGFRTLAKFAGLNILEVFTCWQESTHDSVLITQKPILTDSQRQQLKGKIQATRSLVTEFEFDFGGKDSSRF